jgi:hypothetical protein
MHWLGVARELTDEEKNFEILMMAIRLEAGNVTRACARLHSVGARGSMRCLIDPMDLLDIDQEHIAEHLRWTDEQKRRGR